ncbi:MAG: sigma 54-interacting transcriptional regulator, partial [Longimicrobiales bacterium]
MSLQVIRLDGESGQELPHRFDLGPDIRLALMSARSTGSPLVLIIANENAAAFACCDDLIVRKRKSRSKHLAYLALGKPHIPFVRGEYSSNGKALQSFRTLLQRARERLDNNVYLMVVSAQIFAELWSQAISLPHTESARPGRSAPNSGPAQPTHALTPDTQTLMKLLPDVVIPDKLVQEFIGDSLEVRLVRKFTVKASENEKPVLILGDSGTGKEVVARLIHDLGARRTATFMAVNCGAIPRDLFESMLFGYVKGAHSTAFFDKDGLWRVADNGTLFLDEIADLALDHQVKILRVLDQGEILPVGAREPIAVNARILAATNKDLFAMVKAGQFREDLYYRLRAMLIRTPSLRSHPNDIPALVGALWKKATGDDGSELSAEVLAVLR